jgi:hypothetical protein
MENEDFGVCGDDIADALFEGIDLNHLAQDLILGSLLESPENLKELTAGKNFPMNQDSVLIFFMELQSEGIINEKFAIKELPEGEYSEDQVLEILNNTLSRMVNTDNLG